MKNQYSFQVSNGIAKGAFNIYQARDGRVYLVMGNCRTALTHQQITDLNIDVFSLVDFDYDDFLNAYRLETELV